MFVFYIIMALRSMALRLRNLPILATDNSDIGILCPIKIGYLSPLLFGAFVLNCSQRVAIRESIPSNACYALRDSDRGQRVATRESPLSNTRYALRNSDRGQRGAIRESIISNNRYTLRNSDRGQLLATIESIISNNRYTLRRSEEHTSELQSLV